MHIEAGALTLAHDNGDPTAPIPIQRLKDGQTANPLDRSGALSRRGFAYLTDLFVDYILPNKKPDLTIFWSKEPDATSHAYGPGTYNSIDATRMNDEILGRVMGKLRELGWEGSTDIIITQDHGHSTVSGDLAHYPLRGIADGGVGSVDPQGYSVSGFVRTAELLSLDGLKAYDGASCRNVPVLSGIRFDGTHFHPTRNDVHGSVCGKAQRFTSPSYVVPWPIPAGRHRRRRERRQRLPVRPGSGPQHGQRRSGELAEPPAVRCDLCERQVRSELQAPSR